MICGGAMWFGLVWRALVKLAVGAACLVAGPCGLSGCCWYGALLVVWRAAVGMARCCWYGALLLVWRAAVGMARCWWYGALLVLALKHLLQDAVRAVYCWYCHLGLLC